MANLSDIAQPALDEVCAEWNRAGANWDADGLAATYCEDGLLFGGRPGHYVGRAAIRSYFATYDGVILAGGMTLSETALRVLGEDCVLAQGMVCFAFTLADQARTRSTLRATLVLRREAGRWRILEHHFSSEPAAPPLGRD
ncbi:YybH family protein [Bordetella genomosp. 6]|uniref:YybH family protein n=1 Tax=Bordetella genomosp. 6 TaxID=463024 RepID=UPI000A2930D1|nr:SgcJ/EcaC family oxidoreductase [Bordetella genomosp. 6]ARP78525.1 DUF4440 domain-containing protein [Bordetella genomosp. 6]